MVAMSLSRTTMAPSASESELSFSESDSYPERSSDGVLEASVSILEIGVVEVRVKARDATRVIVDTRSVHVR